MSKKSEILAFMAIAMNSSDPFGNIISSESVFIHDKPKPIPSGTKEYFFNDAGEFSTSSMRKDECVFKCYAINDKNAIRKFNKWQPLPTPPSKLSATC